MLSYSQGAAYGWRARIGMLKPSAVIDNNAHEFYLMAPPGVELFVTSLGVGGMRQDEYDKAIANFEHPLRLLLHHQPDVILQAGVPPIVTRGWGFEDTLRASVAEITSIPFFSDVGASINGLRALGCGHVLMVSFSFDDELTEHIRRYLEAAGIQLIGSARVRESQGEDAAVLPLERVYRTTRKLFNDYPNADGIWITHASMPSIGVIDDLERDLRVPVVSSAQALMWAGLRAAGIREPFGQFGRLMSI
jgi:maleate isomerase